MLCVKEYESTKFKPADPKRQIQESKLINMFEGKMTNFVPILFSKIDLILNFYF